MTNTIDPNEPADFFRARIDAMIDMRDPLAVLATRMPWDKLGRVINKKMASKALESKVLSLC